MGGGDTGEPRNIFCPFLIKFYKALYIAQNKGSTDAKIPKTVYVPSACLPESINQPFSIAS